ncbi:MAG TPA: glycosyl transferase family 1 [Firmicutes bacterium]|nr:glycosyl transferase family 1 [Bacillota bacterium]
MKVLLYFQNQDTFKKSGIGRALKHQITALTKNGIEYTLNPKDDFDIAHINTYFGKSQKVLKKCKKRGIPVIVHGHSTFEDFRDSFRAWRMIEPYYDRCLKKMYSNADYIITPTPYSKKLISNYSFVKCPVEDVSNGINLEEYQINESDIDAFRKHFNLSKDDKVIISIGWFFRRKGIDDFIEVARKLPQYKFIWFGHQPKWQTQGKILKILKHRPENVIMPGYIAGPILKGALHGADLMFFPSREETEGIVVLEAMATHLPILVRDIPVYDPWLKDKDNCYKGKDINDFAEQIPLILNDENRFKYAEKAYNDVQEKTLDQIGLKLCKAYKKVLEIKK